MIKAELQTELAEATRTDKIPAGVFLDTPSELANSPTKIKNGEFVLPGFGKLDPGSSRASFKELRQFLPKGKAEAVMAALSISSVADAEQALTAPLNNAEAIFRANLDMKGFH
jgi:hypothetical protein